MWFLIIGGIIIIFIRALFKNRISNKSYQTTDLKIQYKQLITFIIKRESETVILHETHHSISLGRQILQGWTKFNIQREPDRILIEWTNKDMFKGKLYSKWQFKFTTSQSHIIEIIKFDILKMQEDLKNQNNSN